MKRGRPNAENPLKKLDEIDQCERLAKKRFRVTRERKRRKRGRARRYGNERVDYATGDIDYLIIIILLIDVCKWSNARER